MFSSSNHDGSDLFPSYDHIGHDDWMIARSGDEEADSVSEPSDEEKLKQLEEEFAALRAKHGVTHKEMEELEQRLFELQYKVRGDHLVVLKERPGRDEKSHQPTQVAQKTYQPIPLKSLHLIGDEKEIEAIKAAVNRYNLMEGIVCARHKQSIQEEDKENVAEKTILLVPHEMLANSMAYDFANRLLSTYIPNLDKGSSHQAYLKTLYVIIDTRPTGNRQQDDEMRANIEVFKSRLSDPRNSCLEYSSANREADFNKLMLFLTKLCGIEPVPNVLPQLLSEKEFQMQKNQAIANAFKKIYAAMYYGEKTGFKSSDLLEKLYKVVITSSHGAAVSSHYKHVRSMSFDSLSLIISEKEPTARSVAAWSLAKVHHDNCYADNKDLFNAIYIRSFKESGAFKQAHIAGKTFFLAKSAEEALKKAPNFLVKTAKVLPPTEETSDKWYLVEDENRKDIIATRLGKRPM